MIAALIRWSLGNRFLVLLGTVFLAAWGLFSLSRTPLDALPDLSDVQVIIRTTYPGQAPRVMEDQVTYPLTTTMMSVPGAKTVRGYSFFGDSFVYVIFEDGTDLYWARSRVLEYLSKIQSQLPAGVRTELGPDATGVGWVYSTCCATARERTPSTSCAPSRTGRCATRSRACRAWPRSPPSAATAASTRSPWTPTGWPPTACRSRRSPTPCGAPTTRPAAA